MRSDNRKDAAQASESLMGQDTGVAVITGTTHGIGRVTARELARAGLTVVMLCRDLAMGRGVRDEIGAAAPGARVHVLPCDLASLKSVRECAQAIGRQQMAGCRIGIRLAQRNGLAGHDFCSLLSAFAGVAFAGAAFAGAASAGRVTSAAPCGTDR